MYGFIFNRKALKSFRLKEVDGTKAQRVFNDFNAKNRRRGIFLKKKLYYPATTSLFVP